MPPFYRVATLEAATEEGHPMPPEAIYAGIAFAGMFTMWVVLPSHLRRRHGKTPDAE